MADQTMWIEMFPRGFWRWNFCCVWSDGISMRSSRSSFGYGRTLARAHRIAQEARRG